MESARPLRRRILVLALALLALLTVPLLMLGGCAVPCADDYSFGAPARLARVHGGSVIEILAAGVSKAAETWRWWQGSFSAVFLMAVQPAVFGEGYYALTPWIMLSALFLGTFVLLDALFTELFRADRLSAAITAAAVCALCAELVPSPVQALYWFNGAVYYVFFHGLLLLALALSLRLVRRGGWGRGLALCLLAFALGGGNYVTALCCAILGAGALLLLCLLKTPGRFRLVPPLLLFAAAFALSAAAPGNAARASALASHPDALTAVLLSFRTALAYLPAWTSLPLIGALCALFPLLYRAAADANFRFPCPWLVTLGSFCLLSAMFCPPIYAMGGVGEQRLINIIYFSYVLLCPLNLFYWAGWAAKRRSLAPAPLRLRTLVPGAAALLLCCALYLLSGSGGGFSSVGALGIMRSGEARAFRDCADRRLAVLLDPDVRDAELERYPSLPWLLYYDDVCGDIEDWRNVDMSSYYEKNSVRLADA